MRKYVCVISVLMFGIFSGIICGILGQEGSGGKFAVEDICFAGLPEPVKHDVVEDDRLGFFAFWIRGRT